MVFKMHSEILSKFFLRWPFEKEMKACEVPLPVGKVPNSTYDEAPNCCRSVSAPLGTASSHLETASSACKY